LQFRRECRILEIVLTVRNAVFEATLIMLASFASSSIGALYDRKRAG